MPPAAAVRLHRPTSTRAVPRTGTERPALSRPASSLPSLPPILLRLTHRRRGGRLTKKATAGQRLRRNHPLLLSPRKLGGRLGHHIESEPNIHLGGFGCKSVLTDDRIPLHN